MFSMIASAAGHDDKLKNAAPAKDTPIGIQGGVITVSFSEAADTQALIEVMDGMIAQVDGARADLGAIQNHCPEIEYPKGQHIKHSHYKKLMVPLEPFFLPLIL